MDTRPDLLRHDRLRRARIAAGFEQAQDAADRFGWNRNTYKSNENGNAPFSFSKAKDYATAFKVRAEWLYDGAGPMVDGAALTPVIGRAGANPDGEVLFADGQGTGDWVPLPPGGSARAVALWVVGTSMYGFADDGALIYFEDQRSPVTEDLLGQVAVLETEDGEVLIKRIRRGSAPGLYNLESIAGPMREDVRIRWAAHVTAVVPPHYARRIVVRDRSVA